MDNISTDFIDRTKLKDINSVVIDSTAPCTERVKSYIEQIGNPYCYLDGEIVVEIEHAKTAATLHDRLLSYASNLDKNSGSLW